MRRIPTTGATTKRSGNPLVGGKEGVGSRAFYPLPSLLVSVVALAVEPGWRVHAPVRALVELDARALVHVAVGRLVAVVRAVRHLVAHQRRVDALRPVGAPEHLRAARRCRRAVFAGAPELVRVVAAVVLAVAPVRGPHALEVLARELARRARLVLAVTLLALVRAVAAVVVVVAHPSAVDAPPVAARELVRAAVCHRRAVERGRVLVGPVHAVRVAVAQPLARYALRPVPRLVRRARELGRFVALPVVCVQVAAR